VNENGSPLKEIRIYQVRYDFPPPGEDQHAFFKELMAKTHDHKTQSDYVYTTFFGIGRKTAPPTARRIGQFIRAYRTSFGLTELENNRFMDTSPYNSTWTRFWHKPVRAERLALMRSCWASRS